LKNYAEVNAEARILNKYENQIRRRPEAMAGQVFNCSKRGLIDLTGFANPEGRALLDGLRLHACKRMGILTYFQAKVNKKRIYRRER